MIKVTLKQKAIQFAKIHVLSEKELIFCNNRSLPTQKRVNFVEKKIFYLNNEK